MQTERKSSWNSEEEDLYFTEKKGYVLPDALLAVFTVLIMSSLTVALLSVSAGGSAVIHERIRRTEEMTAASLQQEERCEKTCEADVPDSS